MWIDPQSISFRFAFLPEKIEVKYLSIFTALKCDDRTQNKVGTSLWNQFILKYLLGWSVYQSM